MTGLDNVGTRSKRREKKHYDEHQDTRCVWEAFGSAAPSRSPSPSPSVPCSPQGAAAGRVLDAGFYDLHIGGRKVWRCLLPQAHTEARGGAPQDTMQKGADWSVEYGFGRLGKPVARTSQVALEWPELRVANAPTLDASRGKSRVGHFGQDSHQTMACLQMMPSGREHVTVSPQGASPGRSINPTNDSWVGWSKEEGQASVKEQAELLSQEEVRAGMVRRAGRRLRPTSPNNALRANADPFSSVRHDDLRIEKHLPCRGKKVGDWTHNSSRMADILLSPRSPREEPSPGVRSAGPSELWAPWLLSYEKELRTRHTLGAVPSAVPLPLRLLGSKLKRGSSAERSRSPDPGGFAGKPSQEAPVVGRPFWLGEPNSATPETTSHAHYGRSTSPKVRRGSVQPKMKNEGASGASNPLQLPSSRSPKPETEGREKEEAAQSSPSRFKHDNPKSLREQLAEETFLPASKIQPAGKPITFSPAVDVSIPQRTSERRVRPSKGSGTFPRSVSPPASFEAWR
ncbi:unnamed protein product [Durusdinium trenchii]|uniref:RBPJ-interacting and tubulin-associated protein 1 n=1 Tax=Durusdinium trenchii TaxID=1381693 RepID=A0ABP0JIX4_9DINO